MSCTSCEFLALCNSEYENCFITGEEAMIFGRVTVSITTEWKQCEKCRLLFGELYEN